MKASDPIEPGEDILDSRDIIARIEYLTDERDGLQEAVDEAEGDEEKETAQEALDEWEEEYGEELENLTDLQDECEGYSDWKYGETLIRDSYFKEYAEQFAEGIGAIDRNASWPNNHIDWDEAADALKMDYSEVTFGDETYYIRNC